jgi:hypothetical protein
MRIEFLKKAIVFAIVSAIIVCNTPTVKAWEELIHINWNTYQQFNTFLSDFFRADSGLQVLPDQTRSMLYLIQEHALPNFRLSPLISSNVWVSQRIIESAWPIHLEPESDFLFVFLEEVENYSSCKKLDEKEDIVLVHCD